ncbi:MAG: DUF86 domain-containing protein [Desulfococcaceae bacterium]
MKDSVRKHLFDIREAIQSILRFVNGKSFSDYEADDFLRSAVERKFEIVGEALNRIRKDDPELLKKIGDYRSAISFRNILIQGYDGIGNRIVWGIIETDIPVLLQDVDAPWKEWNPST